MFITFEGGEGSGKTTQSKRLYEHLKTKGVEVVWTREPGGTPLSEKIRDVLVKNDMDKKTELLLAVAARVEHYKHVIAPALGANKVVICDRFIDSSLAYQGSELGTNFVMSVHKHIFGDMMPDITFLIDVPVEVGLKRAISRGGNNRFEDMEQEKHQKIRDTFLEVQSAFPERIHLINGNREQDIVFNDITNQLPDIPLIVDGGI